MSGDKTPTRSQTPDDKPGKSGGKTPTRSQTPDDKPEKTGGKTPTRSQTPDDRRNSKEKKPKDTKERKRYNNKELLLVAYRVRVV